MAAPAALACAARIRSLYPGDLPADAGVLHVASVWQAPDGLWRSLKICDATPASQTDAFALRLARARARAVITTGRILREEPRLVHAIDDVPDGAALLRWRRDVLGLDRLPESVVLTARDDLDLTHPLFATGRPEASQPKTWVLTTRAAARRLFERQQVDGVGRGVGIVGRDRPGIVDTLRWLREERRLGTVALEAGPSTTSPLYRGPRAVDELMLSVYEGAAPPPEVLGAVFASRAEIESQLTLCSHTRSDEDSGPWSFLRFRRPDSV